MARYRKIDVRMWNDRKFRELSDNGKLAFILLLTHPDTTQIGTIRTRVSNLADELGWQRDAMSHAIQEVTLNGMIDADEKAGLMVINNFLKYNAPSSPKADPQIGGANYAANLKSASRFYAKFFDAETRQFFESVGLNRHAGFIKGCLAAQQALSDDAVVKGGRSGELSTAERARAFFPNSKMN